MRYLSEKYPEHVDSKWYPHEPHIRARINEMMDWHHDSVRQGASKLVWYLYFGPVFLKKRFKIKIGINTKNVGVFTS